MARASFLLAVTTALFVSTPAWAQPPTSDGFVGPRPLLVNLSADDQNLLASLIDKYTSANDNAVIKIHENTMTNPALYDVHERPYTQLFTFHHTYLGNLETFLSANGGAKFVPLPKWIPSAPIPKIFGYHNGKKVIKDFKPTVDWSAFVHSKLGVFSEDIWTGPTDTTPDASILANTLVVPHNNTHNMIAGIMSTMSSPTAPIFWCYHAFIDDIWTDWQSVHKNAPKLDKLTLDATPPGPTQRSMQITPRVDTDGNVFADAVGTTGSYPVTSDPFKSILADAAGKPVWVQATFNPDGTAAITGVSAQNSMKAVSVLASADSSAAPVGKITGMSEIHIVDQSGDFFQVQLDGSGTTGFVAKSSVDIASRSVDPATVAAAIAAFNAAPPSTDPMAGMPGMGSMPGMNMDPTPPTPGITSKLPPTGP